MFPERFALRNGPISLPKRSKIALLQIRNYLRKNDGYGAFWILFFPGLVSTLCQPFIIMVYTSVRAFCSNNPNHKRCTMKVAQAVDFHLQYHRANSKKKYCQNL